MGPGAHRGRRRHAGRVHVLDGRGRKQPDNVSFTGSRRQGTKGPCAVLVRKTPEGYRRIADGVVTGPSSIRAQPEKAFRWSSRAPGHGRSSFSRRMAKRFFALKSSNELLRIAPDGGAAIPSSIAGVPGRRSTNPKLSSIWGQSEVAYGSAEAPSRATSGHRRPRRRVLEGRQSIYEVFVVCAERCAVARRPTRSGARQARTLGRREMAMRSTRRLLDRYSSVAIVFLSCAAGAWRPRAVQRTRSRR